MVIKIIILTIVIIELLFDFYEMRLLDEQRQKPLPEEVADVFSPERYQTFLDYKADQRRLNLISSLISILITLIILFSPLFAFFESLSAHNIYMVFAITLVSMTIVNQIISTSINYYRTFTIEEKYGKNKKNLKTFIKDECLDFILEFVLSFLLYLPIIYLCEHMSTWTHQFHYSYGQSFVMALIITLIVLLIMGIIMLISYVALRLQYHFTDLEEGELRDKIVALMADSKKKVKIIRVYDESKKSTSKNAFLLKLFYHKEFGIADNFITENAEDELLAVLSHEVGHLKHKKNIFNYLNYLSIILVFLLIVYLIPHGQSVISFNKYVMNSFSLTMTNYYLVFYILSALVSPAFSLISLYRNFVSRKEEYEADANAVKEGYGEVLIRTFKQLSTDELIDVNPPKLIEMIEYDHPSMYHRIIAIREGEAALSNN